MGRPKKEPVLKTCSCGKIFIAKRVSHICCSLSCAAKRRNLIHADYAENNPNWRGGKSSHPYYWIYHDMIARCHRITHTRYTDYGGRGIKVCEEWQKNFWQFVSDVGERPSSKYSMDRINNDGNYEPNNFRWATLSEQAKNKRGYGPMKSRNEKGQFI